MSEPEKVAVVDEGISEDISDEVDKSSGEDIAVKDTGGDISDSETEGMFVGLNADDGEASDTRGSAKPEDETQRVIEQLKTKNAQLEAEKRQHQSRADTLESLVQKSGQTGESGSDDNLSDLDFLNEDNPTAGKVNELEKKLQDLQNSIYSKQAEEDFLNQAKTVASKVPGATETNFLGYMSSVGLGAEKAMNRREGLPDPSAEDVSAYLREGIDKSIVRILSDPGTCERYPGTYKAVKQIFDNGRNSLSEKPSTSQNVPPSTENNLTDRAQSHTDTQGENPNRHETGAQRMTRKIAQKMQQGKRDGSL